MTVTMSCKLCGKGVSLPLTEDQLHAIMRSEEHIQNIPEAKHLSSYEREMFISGFCKSCLDKMFKDEED